MGRGGRDLGPVSQCQLGRCKVTRRHGPTASTATQPTRHTRRYRRTRTERRRPSREGWRLLCAVPDLHRRCIEVAGQVHSQARQGQRCPPGNRAQRHCSAARTSPVRQRPHPSRQLREQRPLRPKRFRPLPATGGRLRASHTHQRVTQDLSAEDACTAVAKWRGHFHRWR